MKSIDVDRYSRQIIMEQIGVDGQKRLSNAKVTVAGLGGLGSLVALQLTGMGIGKINLIDRDIVTKTDLHRQYLYNEADLGRLKVLVAKEKLNKLNSTVQINVLDSVIDERSVNSLIHGSDLVIDCLDSTWGKYSLNRACIEKDIPLVFASSVASYAVVSSIIPGNTACLKCIYPSMDEGSALTCAIAGVHPSILGITASIQVSEAVNFLTGKGFNLLSKLLFIDLNSLSFDTVSVKRNERCSECGSEISKRDRLMAPEVEKSCSRDGRGTYFLNSGKKINLNLDYEDFRQNGLHKAFEDEKLIILLKRDGSAIALVNGKVEDVEALEKELLAKYKSMVEPFR